ncbi:MAG: hypothetical protein HY707_06035, partial [Ignavibacteriae bacterium]|nr:hypothetical protein [Ignavibacteriota bacterium]
METKRSKCYNESVRALFLNARKSKGVSIFEIVIIVLIISILAIIIVPNYLKIKETAQWEVCLTNQANINALAQLYYIKEGTWPNANLSDIKTNLNYFPEQTLPECPVTD